MKRISFDEFDTWVANQPAMIRTVAFFDDADEFGDEGVAYHKGDLVTDTLPVAPVTVIEGDLTVQKIAGHYNNGVLVVTGKLTCPSIARMNITIIVGGDLIARSLCLDTMNDYGMFVGGDIRCDYFAEFGCSVEVQGKIICPKVLNLMNTVIAHGGVEGEFLYKFRGRDINRILIDAVLTDDGYFSEARFLEHTLRGESPYR